jgi:branched-chain amino acid transport system ATP-binding protein
VAGSGDRRPTAAGGDGAPLLSVEDLAVAYGPVRALRGVSLEVRRGEVVAVLGPNGAGKSTLLRAIAGVVPPASGRVVHAGERIDGLSPEDVVRRGIALVPEGRMVFPGLTVRENLLVGAISRRDAAGIAEDLEGILGMFPVLGERAGQLAGTLSGGEQQMLAIGRALMSRPSLLLLDEPSLGLAPIVVDRVFELIAGLRERGVTVLLVEQNVHRALELADRGYVLAVGRVALSGTGEELRGAEGGLHRAYLGIGGGG